jgi:hypothetical protein
LLYPFHWFASWHEAAKKAGAGRWSRLDANTNNTTESNTISASGSDLIHPSGAF